MPYVVPGYWVPGYAVDDNIRVHGPDRLQRFNIFLQQRRADVTTAVRRLDITSTPSRIDATTVGNRFDIEDTP